MNKPNVITDGFTTVMKTSAEDVEAVMTGKERYPVFGKALTLAQVNELLGMCRGLNLYWSCIEKALLVREYLGFGVVVGGRCMVVSKDGLASYGHYWRPPYELHAWWQKSFEFGQRRLIIDLALPGLILKGRKVRDDQGPLNLRRKPVVLAGLPKAWMGYAPMKVIA